MSVAAARPDRSRLRAFLDAAGRGAGFDVLRVTRPDAAPQAAARLA